MLADMLWIMGSRFPVSQCIQPAADAAMGHGNWAYPCMPEDVCYICMYIAIVFILLMEH